MENYFEKNLMDEISYCLSKSEMAKVNFDFKEKFVDEIKAKSADLVILITDKINELTLKGFIKNGKKLSPTFNFMSKFLIVTTNSKNTDSLASTMTACHILNFGIVYEDIDDEPTAFTTNHFFNTTTTHKKIKREEIIDRIYPDKLKDLNYYNYKVILSSLMAHIDETTGEIFSKYLYFFQEISKIQNAKINLTVWHSTDFNLGLREVEKIRVKQGFDILFYKFPQNYKNHDSRLNIYEQNGICFIIPITRMKYGNLKIFLTIFNESRLTFVMISSFIVIWLLYKKRGAKNSTTEIALFLWATAFDQTLKLRKNRLVLNIMLQLFVFAMIFRNFVLNADFTSNITVFTTSKRYKTFSELIESKEKFIAGGFVDHSLENTDDYRKLKAEDRIKIVRYIKNFDRIIISQCMYIQIYGKMNNWAPDSYYVLPEKISFYYSQFEVGILNPFKEMFQKYIDMSFESGLMQIWSEFYRLKKLEIKRKYLEKIDENFLTWKEIRAIYLNVFGFGFTLATFAFICEISYFYIFRHWLAKVLNILKRKCLKKKKRKTLKMKRINLGKKKTRNPMKLNVKRIKVHPVNNKLDYLE